MLDKSANNPPISSYLRLVTGIECFVVLVAAAGLFFLPELSTKLWAWEIPPFNSRFVGAVYFSALFPLIIPPALGYGERGAGGPSRLTRPSCLMWNWFR